MICPACFCECKMNVENFNGFHLINNRCDISEEHSFFHQNREYILDNRKSCVHHLIIRYDNKNFTIGNFEGQYFFTVNSQEIIIEEFDVCHSIDLLNKYIKMKVFL